LHCYPLFSKHATYEDEVDDVSKDDRESFTSSEKRKKTKRKRNSRVSLNESSESKLLEHPMSESSKESDWVDVTQAIEILKMFQMR
jgi:hypothetical protein